MNGAVFYSSVFCSILPILASLQFLPKINLIFLFFKVKLG